MSDGIGILGQSTITTVGTNSVYICPAGKAAKVRIQMLMQAAANTDLGILVNGVEVARTGALTVNDYVWTPKATGILLNAQSAAKPDGLTAAKTVQPADPIYYLSAGDSIQYSITTLAPLSMNIQVVGIEIDLAA